MYCITITVYSGQYLLADVFQFTLVSPVTGQPMKPVLASEADFNHFQSIENNATNINRNQFVSLCNTLTAGFCSQAPYWENIFFDLFTLLTGTNGLFLIMVFFGIPGLFVNLMLIPYYLLFFRTILGYAKSFF